MRNEDDDKTSSSPSQISKTSDQSKMTSQPPKITTSSIDVADASSDQEKNIHPVGSTSSDPASNVVPFNEVATKKLLRKLDVHLIPFLALMYL